MNRFGSQFRVLWSGSVRFKVISKTVRRCLVLTLWFVLVHGSHLVGSCQPQFKVSLLAIFVLDLSFFRSTPLISDREFSIRFNFFSVYLSILNYSTEELILLHFLSFKTKQVQNQDCQQGNHYSFFHRIYQSINYYASYLTRQLVIIKNDLHMLSFQILAMNGRINCYLQHKILHLDALKHILSNFEWQKSSFRENFEVILFYCFVLLYANTPNKP